MAPWWKLQRRSSAGKVDSRSSRRKEAHTVFRQVRTLLGCEVIRRSNAHSHFPVLNQSLLASAATKSALDLPFSELFPDAS
jgi:hypothetical protein